MSLSRRETRVRGIVEQANEVSGGANLAVVTCLGPSFLGERQVYKCFNNPDLRRTEPIIESPLQRTSSGSSSSSSTPSSQPSSQAGSQPGSQAGSSERNRVRGNTKPEGSPILPHEPAKIKQEEGKDLTRPSRPASYKKAIDEVSDVFSQLVMPLQERLVSALTSSRISLGC
ncbi:UNVERIFIED_CONTAM: hypothetical protein K2H54_059451 [Gekko kuhli]